MATKTQMLRIRGVILGLIVLGGAICIYLLYRQTQLQNASGNTRDICQLLFGSGCDVTLSGRLSWQLNLPLAGMGTAYFGLVGLLLSIRKPFTDRMALLVSAFGVGISLVLGYLMLLGKISCPFCLLVHIINIAILAGLVICVRPTVSGNEEKRRTRYGAVAWSLLLLVAIVAGGFAEAGMLKATFQQPAVNVEEVAAQYMKADARSIPFSLSTPRIGPVNAPVQLVVFSSFQCPSCKGFAGTLETLQKKYGDKMSITFRNFPLSTTCNNKLLVNMQPRSCEAAIAALAAQSQNKFWEYHDGLFQSDLSADEKTLASIAESAGLNMLQWTKDRSSDAINYQLAEDIKIANALRINATPSVFINGRYVSSNDQKVLDFLIQHELEK